MGGVRLECRLDFVGQGRGVLVVALCAMTWRLFVSIKCRIRYAVRQGGGGVIGLALSASGTGRILASCLLGSMARMVTVVGAESEVVLRYDVCG